jgi:hypothetical protein
MELGIAPTEEGLGRPIPVLFGCRVLRQAPQAHLVQSFNSNHNAAINADGLTRHVVSPRRRGEADHTNDVRGHDQGATIDGPHFGRSAFRVGGSSSSATTMCARPYAPAQAPRCHQCRGQRR